MKIILIRWEMLCFHVSIVLCRPQAIIWCVRLGVNLCMRGLVFFGGRSIDSCAAKTAVFDTMHCDWCFCMLPTVRVAYAEENVVSSAIITRHTHLDGATWDYRTLPSIAAYQLPSSMSFIVCVICRHAMRRPHWNAGAPTLRLGPHTLPRALHL